MVVNVIVLAECKILPFIALLALNLVGESIMIYLAFNFDFFYNGYWLLLIEAACFVAGLILYLIIYGIIKLCVWVYHKVEKSVKYVRDKTVKGLKSIKAPRILRKKTRME